MVIKSIIMGKCRRFITKVDNESMILTETQSQVFEDLQDYERLTYVKQLMEAKRESARSFRVKYAIGSEEHNRIVKAVDEKGVVAMIHQNGGNVISVELVSEDEARRQPNMKIRESFIKKFKYFK